MNTRDLEYFHKLAELASFTIVAEFFGVSQPTITYAVKRLEEAYHCDLVIKDCSHRSVTLTAEGEILDNHIKTILMELEVAKKRLNAVLIMRFVWGFHRSFVPSCWLL